MALYLTPAAIGYLAQLILALLITGYLTYHAVTARRRDAAAFLLIGVFAAVVGVVLLFFLDAALPPSPRLYAVYLENTVIGLLLTLLTQFAYRFPRLYPQRKWEARLALAANLGYTLWEAGFALQRGGLLLQDHLVQYRPELPDYALAACFAWLPLAFLRQTIAASQDAAGRAGWFALPHLGRPQGPAAQTARAFALIFFIPLALSLLNIGRATFTISPEVYQSSMSAGILLTQFLFALVYLNAIPEMTSFQVRLVGITLVMVLAVFGAAGWAMTPPHAAAYRPALADHQTLRFTPNAAGGYDVTPVEFHFAADLGRPLDFQLLRPDSMPWEAVADVAFPFPFYGQTAQTLWVMRSGVVSLDAPLDYPSMEYHYALTPAIFPLFVPLESDVGGVFARNEGDRLTITWHQMRTIYGRPGTFTFQAVLYRDGAFEITTNGLPDLPYQPDASPFANVWLMGALPGTPGQSPQPVNFTQAPLQGGPQGIVQDHYLEFRRHLHQLLWPLAALILASSLFVIVGFPIVFYFNLIRPLHVLLEGVRRVDAGDLKTTMPVQYHDEIGFLTQSFNRMSAELDNWVTTLEAQVSARTADLTAANEQLRKLTIAVEQSPSSVIITDPDARIEYVNPAFTRITGYTFDEARGQNPRFLKSGQTPAETYVQLWQTLLAGEVWRGEFVNRKKSGEVYWEYSVIAPLRDAQGAITHYVAIKEDITDRKRAEQELERLAATDPLTGVANRRQFQAIGERIFAPATRPPVELAAMMIDIDFFKPVNDQYGHYTGDAVLRELAARLQENLRPTDVLGRYGGEEFVVLLPHTSSADANQIAERLRQVVAARPILVGELSIPITVSIGVAEWDDTTADLEALLRRADQALYAAKQAGRNRCVVWREELA